MTILDAVRDRLALHDDSRPRPAEADRSPAGESSASELPFAGYDRLDDREVMRALADHSQVELEAVETYERSHRARKPVLDKLRYMRGREPIPGYDSLGVEGITSALKDADLVTIQAVRAYERKFAGRPDVLDEVASAHRLRQVGRPKAAAPGYQPMSAGATKRAPVATTVGEKR
jgi:hypothetical protein